MIFDCNSDMTALPLIRSIVWFGPGLVQFDICVSLAIIKRAAVPCL